MKPARDDDDAMGDDSRRSYLHHGEDDDHDNDEEEQVQQPRAARDVLLSLSSCCPSSSICTQAEEQAFGTMAPPLKCRRRRRGTDKEFECQTCGRQFPTFQALGGHRTSHLRRPAMTKKPPRSKAVQLVHACAICGLGFSSGQALGGHMRRHRLGQDDSVGRGDVDLMRIILHGRPTSSSSSLQLLNLFM